MIKHEVLNAENEDKAGEWAIEAIEDGFTKLRFQNERVKAFWEKTLDSFRQEKKRSRKEKKRDATKNQANPKKQPVTDDLPAEAPLENAPSGEPGKFDVLPGLDDVRAIQLNRSLQCCV